MADEIEKMTHELYYKNEVIAPRQTPALEPMLQDVVKSLKKVEKRVVKQGDATKAKENLDTFSKLLDSVNHLNKRLDPKPTTFTPAEETLRNKEIQNLLYIPQPDEETDEQEEMFARSNAQSQMLHRMAHAIDRLALNTQNDFARKVGYDRTMNALMHQHLEDPRYHDGLHDHLLAHHLTQPHTDDEYNEHLAQHLLFHDAGRTPEYEYLASDRQYNAQNAPLQLTENILNAQPSNSNMYSGLTNAQRSAITQNHLSDVAQSREVNRQNTLNTFAENSYEKFKNFKKV